MSFTVDLHLLSQASVALTERGPIYWVVGGAGSGKTTICRILSDRSGLPLYDMDAHIYGNYHSRFTSQRHPVNTAWSSAPNGLAWLLEMSWEEFDHFNQAALPEYLDLLAQDLAAAESHNGLLIDGGICNPALLGQAIPARQIVCLSAPQKSSTQIWEGSHERRTMKEAVFQLANPKALWSKFLEFDQRITGNILRECEEGGIVICRRQEGTSAEDLAQRVADLLGIPWSTGIGPCPRP